MVGQKFGRLTVLSMEKDYKCKCLCECGVEVLSRKDHLLRGATKSCGCLKSETASKRWRERSTIHGMYYEPLYRVWVHMINRCSGKTNSGSKRDYFDRGIRVCNPWKNNPEVFIKWGKENGYKKGLQIDRIDNNGNYEPANCRFVTPLVNAHNKRPLRVTNNTGYSGVSFIKKEGKFMSSIGSISIDGGKAYLGRFPTPEEACMARNEFIIKHGLPHKIQEVLK